MYSLILDSSTKLLYCALVMDDKLLFEKYINGQNDHAKHIVKVIEEACLANNIGIKDLNKVVCGIGPGSYTGTRMAVTVCKMFCSLMPEISLWEISSLKLMASGSKGKTIAMIDARRGNAFGILVDDTRIIVKEQLINKEDLLKNEHDHLVDENGFIVDPLWVINNADEVSNPYGLVPNYLRETEAERNLHHAD